MTTQEIKSIFISGNLDLSEKQFMQYYLPVISELAKESIIYFNVSDDEGCAAMTQVLLNSILKDKFKVSVYCVGDNPKHFVSNEFLCFTGFKTVEERNAAMTFASNMDLHVILPGKGRSSVEDNLCRRNEPEYNYIKHYINGKTEFWQMFFQSENLDEEINEKEEVIDETEA